MLLAGCVDPARDDQILEFRNQTDRPLEVMVGWKQRIDEFPRTVAPGSSGLRQLNPRAVLLMGASQDGDFVHLPIRIERVDAADRMRKRQVYILERGANGALVYRVVGAGDE